MKGDMTKEALEYQRARCNHWNNAARKTPSWGGYYHQRLAQVYQFLVPPGLKVLEVGCGTGDLLAALEPNLGVGVELSEKMASLAAQRHPELHFIVADAHRLCLEESFDAIILSDLVNDIWDVQSLLQEITSLTDSSTRVILNTYSRLWEMPLTLAQKLRLATPMLPQNWLTLEDVKGLLKLADFEIIRTWQEILWPLPTPLFGPFLNRFLVRIWPFNCFALTNFVIARPMPKTLPPPKPPPVSVIVPARNEAENIHHILHRMPEMGEGTEIVFVEGHSRDNTYAVIERCMAEHPERKVKLLRQPGVGKADAVRLGFSQARGDILMILDADLTVPPEDLPRFYDVLCSGKGEFVNGVRLVYPMEKEAMRYLNLMGNKFFSLSFSWLLGQPIKDTLCGTKVLWKSDYDRISKNRPYFGDFDPFGDFDLLFGASKLNLKLVEVPIRYRERKYGQTNIQRWKHGWLLLRMVLFAAGRIKFV